MFVIFCHRDFLCHQDAEDALAALEINTDSSSNSALSPDLLELDVKPLDIAGFTKSKTDTISGNKIFFQEMYLLLYFFFSRNGSVCS